MNAVWLVEQLRTAAATLHENGEYTAAVALETLAEQIETETDRLRAEQYAAQGANPENRTHEGDAR